MRGRPVKGAQELFLRVVIGLNTPLANNILDPLAQVDLAGITEVRARSDFGTEFAVITVGRSNP